MTFISERAAKVSPYLAGEQPQDKAYIKLNTNENPYAPSPSVEEVLRNARIDELRKYPDPDCAELRRVIADKFLLGTDNVFCGNGSDEVLALAFPAFFDEGDRVAFADITYSFYQVFADFFNVTADIVPLKDFALQPEDYYGCSGKGILIANPNAPTATAISVEEIEKIVANNTDKVVIIDEAYVDFCAETAAGLVKRYPNLLVVRTFSKSYALAGARLGFALGSAPLIDALNRVKNSFNSYTVNRLTQKIGVAALKDTAYFEEKIAKVVATRERAVKQLRAMGLRVLPSDANFLFVEVGEGERLYLALKERGILVRFFRKKALEKFLRVTIGTEEETDAFLQTLSELLTR